jgi:hypothetical protein
MQIPVLVEHLPGKGFTARAGEPFCLTAEGKTQIEALNELQKMIEERKSAGAWIVYLDVPNIDNPMMRHCGTLDPDDPLVQEWQQIMAENRKKADEDPGYP